MSNHNQFYKDINGVAKCEQFLFMLDPVTKLSTVRKLKKLNIETNKGAIASTIRALLELWSSDKLMILSDDALGNHEIDNIIWKKQIEYHYMFTASKNKRSNM